MNNYFQNIYYNKPCNFKLFILAERQLTNKELLAVAKYYRCSLFQGVFPKNTIHKIVITDLKPILQLL